MGCSGDRRKMSDGDAVVTIVNLAFVLWFCSVWCGCLLHKLKTYDMSRYSVGQPPCRDVAHIQPFGAGTFHEEQFKGRG